MFNLTMKSAKNFKYNWKELPEHNGDFWRIEVCLIKRKKYFLAVHEKTFSTNILRAIDFKSPEEIAEVIRELNPWYRYPGISVGKKQNRKLTGTINDMKNTIYYLEDIEDIAEIEKAINDTPWSALPDSFVYKEIEKYIKEKRQGHLTLVKG